ncbi:MAG: FimV/HubP family polar landmark protein [Marinobacterium sp.]
MRRLALSIAVSSALLASQASALGLGELNVKSALNEPLQAEIQLLQVRDLKASDIRPQLADDDAFSLAGLSPSGVLSSVDFDVELNAQGGAKVVISSDIPVREPFISFLMEVNWPNGRLVREYTLLLDPPLFVEAGVQSTPLVVPSAAGTASVQEESVSTEPRKILKANSAQTVQTTLRAEATAANQVYVDVNDTLYTLAQDNRPDESLSVNQMMLAIQRLNPSSFPTNNINVLKAGTVITLPNRAQANELSASQAAIEVRKQYDDWKKGRRTSVPTPVEKAEVTPKVQPIAATSPSQTSDLVDSSEAKLKLVSVDEPKVQASSASESKTEVSQSVTEGADVQPEKEQSGSVIEAEKEDVALQSTQESVPEVIEVTPREQELQALNRDLENQLLVTQESVEKVERDNADLSAKLDSIAEQIQTMQRLIELKDQQVAQLQQQLDQQMQLALQRNEDPIATAIEYVRMNPEIVGGSAVAFLLLLLLLVRSSRKPVPYREPEGGANKTDEVVAEVPSAPSAPLAASTATMNVVEPPSVEPALETPIDPIGDQQSDSESIAKAEAEIQSMIDEVLRARASEQTVQAEMEASNVDVSEESLPNETDDLLSRANAALSSPKMEEQEIAINDSVESIPESDDLEEFFDSELEASLADTDSVESIVEAVEEASAELQDLDFVIEPFDSGVEDEPQESQIPGVDMPEAGSADESPQADTIDEDLVALEAMLGDVSSSDDLLDVEVEQEAESNESSEGDWEFVVEESDSGALDADIEKIFDEVDGDVEVVEEINDTAESEDFDTHFYSGADENETRLDLARAYIEMDDYEAARDILISMKEKGSSAQQQEVANLLDQLDKA